MPPHFERSAGTAPFAGPRMNALKHGLHSESILLPGDDVAEYQRHRLGLFHLYRPQTLPEAEAIESLAECQWLRQRYRPLQERFDEQLAAPETDVAGRVCEPVGHQRLHSAMDVSVHRGRIDRAEARAMAKLLLHQKLRRLGLIEGAARLPAHCYMDAAGVVKGPVPVPVLTPVPEADGQVPEAVAGVSGSDDGRNRKETEQKETREEAGHIGRQPGIAMLPEWPNEGGNPGQRLAESAAPRLPPGFTAHPQAWVGYSMVGSG